MIADLSVRGDKIVFKSAWAPGRADQCKAVSGGKWNADAKVWEYPLSISSCKRLREVFGAQLQVTVELAEWAREGLAAEAALTSLSRSDSASLLNVPKYAPRIAEALDSRTYQQVGAAFGARSGSFGLFDQPGLGKTIQTLAAIVETNGSEVGAHLVFCPSVAVRGVWLPEVLGWLPGRAQVFPLVGTRAERTATLEAAMEAIADGEQDVFVVGNIEMARIKPEQVEQRDGSMKKVYKTANAEHPGLFSIEWDTVIVDESHRALIRTSGQPTQQRAGFLKLKAKRRIALSGTPMRGKPEQLFGTLQWLRPSEFTSYWSWVQRYFKLTSNGYSNYILAGFKPGGEERLAADHNGLFYLRRTKSEVAQDLPAKSYAGWNLDAADPESPFGVWLEMSPEQRRQYVQLEREGAIVFDDETEIVANGHLAQDTRRKQLAGAAHKLNGGKMMPTVNSPKFDWLVEKIEELGISNGEGPDARIVVASQFTRLLNVFAAGLREKGIAVHLLTGETSSKARVEMMNDFQSDAPSARVFLLNTSAGGVAITLDMADDLVILDETFNPDDQEQVEDRIHRVSRMHNVTIHYLRTLDTIEEEVAWITAARDDVQRYLLDGHRGVNTARERYTAKKAA